MSEIKSRPYFSFNWLMRNIKFKKKLTQFQSMEMLTSRSQNKNDDFGLIVSL